MGPDGRVGLAVHADGVDVFGQGGQFRIGTVFGELDRGVYLLLDIFVDGLDFRLGQNFLLDLNLTQKIARDA